MVIHQLSVRPASYQPTVDSEESVVDSCHKNLNLTNEVMIILAPRSSTHGGKPLSRINPICATGGSLHRICETSETRCKLDSQGSVDEGRTGKATPDAGGKSVSEKSQVTGVHQQEPFEKSSSHHTEYFVCLVKDKRTGTDWEKWC